MGERVNPSRFNYRGKLVSITVRSSNVPKFLKFPIILVHSLRCRERPRLILYTFTFPTSTPILTEITFDRCSRYRKKFCSSFVVAVFMIFGVVEWPSTSSSGKSFHPLRTEMTWKGVLGSLDLGWGHSKNTIKELRDIAKTINFYTALYTRSTDDYDVVSKFWNAGECREIFVAVIEFLRIIIRTARAMEGGKNK